MKNYTMYIILALMVVAMYLLVIMPQQRARKKKEDSLSKLKAGDRVITIGGIYARVETIEPNSLLLTVEPGGMLMRVSPKAIAVFPEDIPASIGKENGGDA